MIVLTKEQTDNLKKAELEIFKEFLSVCEKLNLKYYIMGGTMLGAVRHKGFIPWDDDIDVAMPRADYEKFISEGQNHLPEHLFVQTNKTDVNYLNNFAKIRNSNTAFVESSVAHWDINHGVYIDIFPLDYYPEKNTMLFELKNQLMKIRLHDIYKNKSKKPLTMAIRFVSRLVYPSIKNTLRKRDELFKSVPVSDKMVNYCGAWGKKEIGMAEWYGEGAVLVFEGLNVIAPKEYDKWLSHVYGDYMTLPPEEKRSGHHYVDAFDLEQPYTYYRKNKI